MTAGLLLARIGPVPRCADQGLRRTVQTEIGPFNRIALARIDRLSYAYDEAENVYLRILIVSRRTR